MTFAEHEFRQNSPSTELHSPIIPAGESVEDAALRRQMIKYNMESIAAVVAEINLDNDDDSWTDEEENEDADEDDDQDGSGAEEDEDKFGRTKRRVLSDDYRSEMLALEKVLNAKMMQNIGPAASIPVLSAENNKAVGTLTQDGDPLPARKISPAKEVRFADQRNVEKTIAATVGKSPEGISDDTNISTHEPSPKKAKESRFISTPNSTSFIERKNIPPTPASPPSSTTSSVASVDAERNPPIGIHSLTVLERPYRATAAANLQEPDDFDPQLLRQQVATEYYQQRNRRIQAQGGFLAAAEEEARGGSMPLDGEDGGAGRKMSRFRAARLRQRSEGN